MKTERIRTWNKLVNFEVNWCSCKSKAEWEVSQLSGRRIQIVWFGKGWTLQLDACSRTQRRTETETDDFKKKTCSTGEGYWWWWLLKSHRSASNKTRLCTMTGCRRAKAHQSWSPILLCRTRICIIVAVNCVTLQSGACLPKSAGDKWPTFTLPVRRRATAASPVHIFRT